MYNRAKMSRACTLLAAVGVIAVSAGCAGLPLEASWPDVSLFGTPPQIMYVYADQARLIDPVDGSTSELRDSQGDVRLDDAGNPRTWAVQQPASGAVTFYTRPIALDEDTLYLTAYENKLFEIDPVSSRIANDSGVALPGHVVATPLLGANLLYVPLSETNLVALDSETFDTSLRLTHRVLEELGFSSEVAADRVLRFRLHDEELLLRQHLIYDNDAAVVQTVSEAMKDLENLFVADESEPKRDPLRTP